MPTGIWVEHLRLPYRVPPISTQQPTNEQFLTHHCKHCGGGIQFPACGVGTEIACPHCEKTIILEAEADTTLPPSRGGFYFLSKFRFATDLDSLGPPSRWDEVLDAAPSEVINDFITLGLLEPVELSLAELVGHRSSKELKELSKARGLPASGTKETMANRLADADPFGMEKIVWRKPRFRCTTKGRQLSEQFLQTERDAEQNAITQAVAALRQQDIDEACRLIAAWTTVSALRPTSKDAHRDARDANILQIIFTSQLKRHAAFDETQMKNVRVAAAMMQLMGTNNAFPYLEQGLNGGDLDWSLESRMLLFRALERGRLEEIKTAGVKRVEVLGANGCAACAADNKKTYAIELAPVLPHDDCSCEGGCVCMLVAKL